MKLHHYRAPFGNVGDDLNPWLWQKLIPEVFDDDSSVVFVGIGTLLNDRLPKSQRTVVFGTGAGYGTRPPVPDSTWRVYCVRGPLTAAALKLPGELAITDPAALVGTLDLPQTSGNRTPAFMPHHVSVPASDWRTICEDLSLRFIDPGWSVDRVLGELGRSSLLITEAMHGAILADALRIPWIPTVCAEHILALKWIDWCQSMELNYSPFPLPTLWNVESNLGMLTQFGRLMRRAANRAGLGGVTDSPSPRIHPALIDAVHVSLGRILRDADPVMSKAIVFDRACTRLQESLDQLKRDAKAGVFRAGFSGDRSDGER